MSSEASLTEGERAPEGGRNFIEEIVLRDIQAGKNGGRVQFRFPPSPSGYLHIGHAKAILLNWGLSQRFEGRFVLRLDDSNPLEREDEGEASFVEGIIRDLKWLVESDEVEVAYASDYFETVLHDYTRKLLREGTAYICSLSADEMRTQRGTSHDPGVNSPYRSRSPEENLALYERMLAGEFPEGAHCLRLIGDMNDPNINHRDPVLARIMHTPHLRTGTRWPVYPTYNYIHGYSDHLEGTTHSLCSLEFRELNPLYNRLLDLIDADPANRTNQYEFSRLNLSHTVTSKRKVKRLVRAGLVDGFDDPRLFTLSALRRRGASPKALKAFIESLGLTTNNNAITEPEVLDSFLRKDLEVYAPRAMGILDPVPLHIDNFDALNAPEAFQLPCHPSDESFGTRAVPFSGQLWIERADVWAEEDPPNRKWFRLAEGREVRLRGAAIIRVERIIKDAEGLVTAVHCTADPESLGGRAADAEWNTAPRYDMWPAGAA